MIKSARRTIAHVLEKSGEDLDFHQADATLRRVGAILNHRPLSIRSATEDNFYSITPADLLLGRATDRPEDFKEPDFKEQDEEIEAMLPAQEEVAREWWLEWKKSCFAHLVPRTKWKAKYRNVKIGNIALLKYSSKFTAPTFRLCRISDTKEDKEGVVRTCEVTMRPRRQGESNQPTYQYRRPQPFEVGVQRLAVILPIEEQGDSQAQKKPQDQLQEEEPPAKEQGGKLVTVQQQDQASEEEQGGNQDQGGSQGTGHLQDRSPQEETTAVSSGQGVQEELGTSREGLRRQHSRKVKTKVTYSK